MGEDMQRADVSVEIERFVRKNYLLGNGDPIDHHEHLIGSGIIDSTGILELIAFLEGTYTVRFDDSELTAENFQSIQRIADFILRKTSGDHASA
jgi:acyl carrier protein